MDKKSIYQSKSFFVKLPETATMLYFLAMCTALALAAFSNATQIGSFIYFCIDDTFEMRTSE